MAETYEINEHDEVVPYADGRKCLDTRAYRDATPLEIEQRDEIMRLESVNADLLAALDNVLKQMDHDDAPWWIDSPDRGGFDREEIEAAIRQAKGEDDT